MVLGASSMLDIVSITADTIALQTSTFWSVWTQLLTGCKVQLSGQSMRIACTSHLCRCVQVA